MTTITDLYGNKIAEVDLVSLEVVEESEDSNINVYEFGNLILADLLPTVVWLINFVSDLDGSSVSVDDLDKMPFTYDFNEYVYDQPSINYEGFPVELTMDIQEATVLVSDKGGSTVSDTDWTETVLVLTDFLSSVNSILDTTEATMTISDWSGNQNTTTDATSSNSEKYDFNEYAYETTRINYDGYLIQGVVVDISGS